MVPDDGARFRFAFAVFYSSLDFLAKSYPNQGRYLSGIHTARQMGGDKTVLLDGGKGVRQFHHFARVMKK